MSELNPYQYNAPGVYTSAVPGPLLGFSSGAVESLAIFGDTARSTSHAELVTLTGTGAVTLTKAGIDQESIVVSNQVTGSVYSATTDYTLTSVANAAGSLDDQVTIKRVASGSTIADGSRVSVTYRYADENFYSAKVFYDYDDIRDFYGPAFDSSGKIVSELTLAAYVAYQNGARKIVCAATQAAGETPTVAEYSSALTRLSDDESVSVVVSANGQAALHSHLLTHVTSNSVAQRERRAVLGFDGSVTAVSADTAINAAKALNSKRVSLVYPDRVNFYNPETSSLQVVGGHLLAVAVGALAVAQNAALPLTRKSLNGFASLLGNTSEANKTVQTQGGLLVIEERTAGQIKIRHGVTTDPSSLVTREWTVTGQEDILAKTVRNYLDSAGYIGNVIGPDSVVSVRGTVSAALESLVSQGIIRSYQNLKARQLVTPADVIEVRCEWEPSIPLNYIVFKYSINLSTGEESTGTV